MKIFLSYRYTGEDYSVLEKVLSAIVYRLEKNGHTVFCSFWSDNFFKEQKYSHKDILDFALRKLDESDCVLAFVKSSEKSEGMLLELGYSYAKNKKIILAKESGVRMNFVPEIASEEIIFDSLEDLCLKLDTLIF